MEKVLSTILASPLNAIIFIVAAIVISKLLKLTTKVIGILVCCGLAYFVLTLII